MQEKHTICHHTASFTSKSTHMEALEQGYDGETSSGMRGLKKKDGRRDAVRCMRHRSALRCPTKHAAQAIAARCTGHRSALQKNLRPSGRAPRLPSGISLTPIRHLPHSPAKARVSRLTWAEGSASRMASAHWARVDPVVITSSTSTTLPPRSASGRRA